MGHYSSPVPVTAQVFAWKKVEKGDWVKIMDGPLRGLEGRVTKVHPRKFTVVLETLGQALRVNLDPSILKKIEY